MKSFQAVLVPLVAIIFYAQCQLSMTNLTTYGINLLHFLSNNVVEGDCLLAIRNAVLGFPANSDGLKMLLYSGKGLNDLGSITECEKEDSLHYIYLSSKNKILNLKLGLCVPLECDADDLEILKAPVAMGINSLMVSALPKNTSIHDMATKEAIKFYTPLEQIEEINFFPPMFYIAAAYFLTFIGLSIYGSIYTTQSKKESSILFKIFNLRNHMVALFKSNEREDTDLRLFDGIRVLSMMWVILGHTIWSAGKSPVQNPQELIEFVKNPWYAFVYNAQYSVDIFFFLSAFLLCYLTLKKMKKDNGKIDYMYSYVHRILRLYPLLIAMYFMYIYIMPLLANGPLYPQYYIESKAKCDKNWFKIFFFLSNFSDSQNSCLNFTWYLSADIQFFIVALPIIALLYKSGKLGMLLNCLIVIICWITQYILVSMHNLSSILLKYDETFDIYYPRPYMRAPAYFFGIMIGYMYYSYKERKTNFFTSIFLKVEESIKFSWVLEIIGCIGIFSILQLMCYLNQNYLDISFTVDVIYYMFSRPIFIIFLFFLLLPAMVGKSKQLSNILGCSCFNILAKLTYCGYLIHLCFMWHFINSKTQGITFDVKQLLLIFWGYFILTMAVSSLLITIFDSPVVLFDRLMFSAKKAPSDLGSTLENKSQDSPGKELAAFKDAIIKI